MPRAATVRVQSFTEPAPTRVLAVVDDSVFVVGVAGLERWDARGGNPAVRSLVTGLPPGAVRALAADAGRHALWVLTDGGLAEYAVPHGAVTLMPPMPGPLVGEAMVAVAGAHAAWVGDAAGLHQVTADGWTMSAVVGPVAAVAADADGGWWLGTADGLVALAADGSTTACTTADGCALRSVRFVLPLAGPTSAALLAVGDGVDGKQRVAVRRDGHWRTFRLLPEARWDAVVATSTGVITWADSTVAWLAATTRPRPAGGRGDARLVALDDGGASGLRVDVLDIKVPRDATTLAVGAGNDLWFGTSSLGVARVRAGATTPVEWLRSHAVVEHARELSVACTTVDDCWLATGAGPAWHWRGGGFTAEGPGGDVLAMVRGQLGDVIALHREVDAPGITVSRRAAADLGWTAIAVVAADVATDGVVQVRVARRAPDGRLWIVVARAGDDGQWHDGGIAVVDLRTGAVTPLAGVVPPTVLLDLAFDGVGGVWFASAEGIARWRGGRWQRWAAVDGVTVAPAFAVALAPGSQAFVGSARGVGIWDGDRWRAPPGLGYPVHDLATTPAGALWLATDRGVAVRDGDRLRRIDRRRGLLEDRVLDVATDQFGRAWARTAGSLVLITP